MLRGLDQQNLAIVFKAGFWPKQTRGKPAQMSASHGFCCKTRLISLLGFAVEF
jgi:hypothetical protein